MRRFIPSVVTYLSIRYTITLRLHKKLSPNTVIRRIGDQAVC